MSFRHGIGDRGIRRRLAAAFESGKHSCTPLVSVHEPGQWRQLLVPSARDASPGDNTAIPGASQGHVQAAHRFAEVFHQLRVPARIVRIQIEYGRELFAVTDMEADRFIGTGSDLSAVPGKGEIYDREFQALALVNRQDSYQILVVVEAQGEGVFLSFFRSGLPLETPFEPGENTRRRVPILSLGFLQQFGEMIEIGEPARPVGVTQKVSGASLGVDDRAQHRADAS